MDKENNRSAAGLRRSAIAERLRLREEWSALKGTSNENTKEKQKAILIKKPQNIILSFPKNKATTSKSNVKIRKELSEISEVLHGTVVMVDVGSEPRALPLRAALAALGATVVPAWSPLVTHLVWSQGGCRNTRAKARALACRVVSPLWVEGCATSGRKLPERVFPAPTRPSDLPSPSTLRRLLKKAEQENIPLHNFLSDSLESNKERPARLRISSETELDTMNTSQDTSADTSLDKSRDQQNKTSSINPEVRVNTAPRRAFPISMSPPRPSKSKRKLFTQKEAELDTDEESDKETPAVPKKMQQKLTQHGRRELAQAERLARKLMGTTPTKNKQTYKTISQNKSPKIVLTGMSRQERHDIWESIKKLNGKIQNEVNKKTTHILMGTCASPDKRTDERTRKHINKMCKKCHTPDEILSQMFTSNVTVCEKINTKNYNVLCNCNNISGVGYLNNVTQDARDKICSSIENIVRCDKLRTVNSLLGAVRGCRVLYSQWAKDSARSNKWLHHFGYEVPHLVKISQKARIERTALNKIGSEYAYDVFNGMRVKVLENADQKDAVIQLLTLCGAIVQNDCQNKQNQCTHKNDEKTQNRGNNNARTQNDGRNGSFTQNIRKDHAFTQSSVKNIAQNGGAITADCDITIGRERGEVSSKWVFDSIASARMRTTRRYVNKDIPTSVIELS